MLKADNITYKTITLNQMQLVKTARHPDRPERGSKITGVSIDGETYNVTDRFMTSMCSVFGLQLKSVLAYFSPDEVLNRIMAVKGNRAEVRVALENSTNKQALGVSKPTKPYISVDMLENVLAHHGMDFSNASYSNGVVTTWHHPRMATKFNVKGDDFAGRFLLETPIDGYGIPSVFLSLIRQVCTNGTVAHSKAFRSQANLGKSKLDAITTMSRFVESFNNEEGYAVLQQRLESAANSPASLDEYFSFYRLISSPAMASLHRKEDGMMCAPFVSNVTTKLKKMCGSIESYGLVSFEALTNKKRRIIPTSCTVYDLINFATELATHRAAVDQERKIHGWVGTLISSEYDLEGTLENNEQPADLLLT